MQDKRPLLVLLALAIVIVGAYFFVGQRDGSETTSAPSAAPVTTSPTDSEVAEKEDFETAIKRIVDRENSLFENPDPARVADIMTTKCTCYADTRKRLVDLENKGYRFDGPTLQAGRISLIRSTATTAEGVVAVSAGSGKVVDRNNRTIETPTSGGYQPLIYTLEKGEDGIWKVTDRSLQEEIIPR